MPDYKIVYWTIQTHIITLSENKALEKHQKTKLFRVQVATEAILTISKKFKYELSIISLCAEKAQRDIIVKMRLIAYRGKPAVIQAEA